METEQGWGHSTHGREEVYTCSLKSEGKMRIGEMRVMRG